ncbi:alpha/beta hydrolase family protein [Archangium gephyra]|uniref:alpha/beta hydrolase family protein n=1 Tax=Archangium gephyra TaxID=48 RepID=UPI0035D4BBEE
MNRMHWLDALAARFTVARQPRFFEEGWGSNTLLEKLTRGPQGFAFPELSEVTMRPARREGHLLVQEGRFPSPAAVGSLPEACREARFQLLLPRDAGPRPPVCVFLASSGDEGFGLRRFIAKELAREGVGALLLENPYYGSRRPPGQKGPAVRTVVDLLLMFRATAVEATALLGWLLATGHPKVGISGYSMGGSIAAYAAAMFPLPAAVIPLAAAHSSAPVFTEGVLSALPDWEVLGRTTGGPEAARQRLAELLSAAATTALPPLSNPRRAIFMAARQDGFVPSSSTLRLLQHWRGAELRYLSGGHVSAFFTGRSAIIRAILDAFSRVDPLQLPPEEQPA